MRCSDVRQWVPKFFVGMYDYLPKYAPSSCIKLEIYVKNQYFAPKIGRYFILMESLSGANKRDKDTRLSSLTD